MLRGVRQKMVNRAISDQGDLFGASEYNQRESGDQTRGSPYKPRFNQGEVYATQDGFAEHGNNTPEGHSSNEALARAAEQLHARQLDPVAPVDSEYDPLEDKDGQANGSIISTQMISEQGVEQNKAEKQHSLQSQLKDTPHHSSAPHQPSLEGQSSSADISPPTHQPNLSPPTYPQEAYQPPLPKYTTPLCTASKFSDARRGCASSVWANIWVRARSIWVSP